MSWRATAWAIEEPRAAKLSNTALRTLMALADHAHDDGSSAWATAGSLARRLHVSERTIERAVAALKEHGLIRHGNQRLTEHMRADRRAVVWDLDMPGSPSAAARDASASPQVKRADNPVGPSGHGPTGSASRADTFSVNGPTAGVGQNTNQHQEHQRARERDAHGLSVVGDDEEVTYCRRCAHQHAPDASCRSAGIAAPPGWREGDSRGRGSAAS